MPARFTSALLLAAAIVHASVHPGRPSRADGNRLSNKWYHEEDHPAYNLFRRQSSNDGVVYAAIGTPEWSGNFPAGAATTDNMPQAWVDALNNALSAGSIPDIPVSTSANGGSPTYPSGYDPNSDAVCSSTYKCTAAGDIWDAPENTIAISFDDGPLPASDALNNFLSSNNEHATHFYIGSNILLYPQAFQTALLNGDDIAIHTWSHPYMTTKSNAEVVAELGWAMEIVHNSSGGRVPKYWRPPYGDSDTRVRAIAKEVFGLTTVVWNRDTDDWTLDQNPPGTTTDNIAGLMQTWLTGPKSPGLVILEHELSDLAVSTFMEAYPLMVSNGWKRVSLAQLDGLGSYQNAFDSNSPVTPANVGMSGIKPPKANSTVLHKTGIPSASGPHANQKSGAEHYSVASLILSGIATAIAAVAGIVLF
ncbi:carbohydrate esterase family 4 protein [Chiua virens]|nr:carbohydrate esterase family 4 protein [Chiua virens]